MEEEPVKRSQYDFQDTVKVPINFLSYIWLVSFILAALIVWVGQEISSLVIITNVIASILGIVFLVGFYAYLFYPLLRYIKKARWQNALLSIG
ncbi:MAG: hypothetical protein ACW98I_14315, partial [Candidatus Hodarchaeales archaeon]